MGLRLTVVEGPDAGRTFRYERYGPVVFGRDGTPDDDGQRPSDPHVSREHLLFDATRDRLWVEAINRRAGFRLGGRMVLDADLTAGDLIEVGESVLGVERPEPLADEGLLDASGSEPPSARRLSEFVLGREVGRGALGIVHEAVDRASGETLAVKCVRPDLRLDQRMLRIFLREIEIICALDHPHIVRTLAVGEDSGSLWFAMERVPGTDLDRRVQERGPLSPFEAAEMGIGLLRALAHAHAEGVVHRDIKPSNVMLCDRAEGLLVKVVDFGMAKRFLDAGATAITRTGEPRGTLLFASPECLRDAKRARPAADLYSASATLYFALTGRPYFDEGLDGRNVYTAVLGAQLLPLSARRPDVPPALAAVVESAIRERPEDRPASAAAMLRALVAASARLPRP